MMTSAITIDNPKMVLRIYHSHLDSNNLYKVDPNVHRQVAYFLYQKSKIDVFWLQRAAKVVLEATKCGLYPEQPIHREGKGGCVIIDTGMERWEIYLMVVAYLHIMQQKFEEMKAKGVDPVKTDFSVNIQIEQAETCDETKVDSTREIVLTVLREDLKPPIKAVDLLCTRNNLHLFMLDIDSYLQQRSNERAPKEVVCVEKTKLIAEKKNKQKTLDKNSVGQEIVSLEKEVSKDDDVVEIVSPPTEGHEEGWTDRPTGQQSERPIDVDEWTDRPIGHQSERHIDVEEWTDRPTGQQSERHIDVEEWTDRPIGQQSERHIDVEEWTDRPTGQQSERHIDVEEWTDRPTGQQYGQLMDGLTERPLGRQSGQHKDGWMERSIGRQCGHHGEEWTERSISQTFGGHNDMKGWMDRPTGLQSGSHRDMTRWKDRQMGQKCGGQRMDASQFREGIAPQLRSPAWGSQNTLFRGPLRGNQIKQCGGRHRSNVQRQFQGPSRSYQRGGRQDGRVQTHSIDIGRISVHDCLGLQHKFKGATDYSNATLDNFNGQGPIHKKMQIGQQTRHNERPYEKLRKPRLDRQGRPLNIMDIITKPDEMSHTASQSGTSKWSQTVAEESCAFPRPWMAGHENMRQGSYENKHDPVSRKHPLNTDHFAKLSFHAPWVKKK